MPLEVVTGFIGRSLIASAGALVTSGRGGLTYNQALDVALNTTPDRRLTVERADRNESLLFERGHPVTVAIPPPRPQVIPSPSPINTGGGLITEFPTNGEPMTTIIDLAAQLGTQYISSRYGQQNIVQAQPFPALNTTPVAADVFGIDGGVRVGAPTACGDGQCGSPRYLTYDCRTGEYKKKRRRRRRQMLTDSDKAALTFIGTLPKNTNVTQALSQRISRS